MIPELFMSKYSRAVLFTGSQGISVVDGLLKIILQFNVEMLYEVNFIIKWFWILAAYLKGNSFVTKPAHNVKKLLL